LLVGRDGRKGEEACPITLSMMKGMLIGRRVGVELAG
jgi:hypothetical protein